nr:hypothetical protein [Wenjunlia tyrosinilytica]
MAVICGVALAACGSSQDRADPPSDGTRSPSVSVSSTAQPGPSTAATTEPTPTARPTLSNKSFAKGSCVAEDRSSASEDTAFLAEVTCKDPEAFAKVVEREAFDVTKVSRCSKEAGNADKLIQLSRLGKGKDAGKLQYAPVCLRNLAAPHPGDPGQGGGPNIIKGDCLVERKSYGLPGTGTGSGTSSFETACAGTGSEAPDYRVIALGTTTVIRGEKSVPCPPATQVKFTAKTERFIGAVYCAVRM